MSNLKHSISNVLSWTSLTTTIVVLLITGLALITSNRDFYRKEGLDAIIFTIIWFYIIILPFICGTALIVGNRLRLLVRSNFVSLAIWGLFIVWTLTMTL